MKNFIFIILIALSIFSIGYYIDLNSIPELPAISHEDETPLSNISFPHFKFKNIVGKEQKIEELNGKIIILNFWATWCVPCQKEFPIMIKSVASLPEIRLVAISSDTEISDIKKFLAKFPEAKKLMEQERIIIGIDPKGEISSTLFNVLRLPESYIINRNFKIIKKITGSSPWEEGEIQHFLQSL